MYGIAKFAMRSPMAAAIVAAGLLVASFLPVRLIGVLGAPFAVALLIGSASISSLTLLRYGVASSAKSIGMAVLLLAVTGLVAGLQVGYLLLFLVFFWGPAGLAAYVLRQTVRLDLALATLGLLAVLAMVVLYLMFPDQAQLWQKPVDQGLDALKYVLQQSAAGVPGQSQGQLSSGTPALDAQTLAELERTRRLMIDYMSAVSIISFMLIAAFSLLQARYSQAKLFNPGGFQAEFHGLKFGQSLALAGIGICLAAALTGWTMLIGLAIIVVCLFMFQGLAVLHSLVKQGRLNQGWLIGVYVLLVVLQTTVVLAAALGLLDNWLNIAKR